MTEPILQIKNLNSWYGPIQILHDVNMHVKPGEIVSIIGPNGAGKSTIIKSIFGIVTKKKGNIVLHGHHDVTKLPTNEVVKCGVSYVPQGRSIFPSLTVLENLELGAYIKADNVEEKLKDVYHHFPILKDRKDQKAGLLSGGEQQMVAIGRALMLSPRLIMLDEPTLGLAPRMKKIIFDKIVEINKEGVAILMVEQNAHMSLKLSNRAYVLELGKNKYEGPGTKLLKDPKVKKLYLGGA